MSFRIIFTCIIFINVCLAQNVRIIPFEPYKTTNDTVLIIFKVFDTDGRQYTKLQQKDIRIIDNEKEIVNFGINYSEPPFNKNNYVVLILDISGSMKFNNKIERLKQSSISIIRALKPTDYCAIVTFANTAKLIAPFTNDKYLLEEKINKISATNGYTAIYDAMLEGIKQLESQQESINKVIMLITDGREEGNSLLTLADVTPRIQKVKNLTIHTFDLAKTPNLNDLVKVSVLGNGSYTHDPLPERVFESFENFFSEYKKAYIIHYPFNISDTVMIHNAKVSLAIGNFSQQIETSYLNYPREKIKFVKDDSFLGGYGIYYVIGICLIGMVVIGIIYLSVRNNRRHKAFASNPEPTITFDSHHFAHAPDPEPTTMNYSQFQEYDDQKTVIIDKAKPAVLAYFYIKTHDKRDELVEINSSEILMGRGAECRIRFDEMEVSRLHSKLRYDEGKFILYDLGSGNGTFVNDVQIQKQILNDGDKVKIGNNVVIFKTVSK